MSGAIAYTFVYPIDLMKTMISINKANERLSVWGNIQHMARTKGVASLYKGLGTTICGIVPYAGLKFFFFEEFKYLVEQITNRQSFGPIENMLFGGAAGCAAVSITYPTDVLRRKRQVQVIMHQGGLSYRQLLQMVWKQEGIYGFYKGLAVTYYKVIPSTALAFAINEALKKYIIPFASTK